MNVGPHKGPQSYETQIHETHHSSSHACAAFIMLLLRWIIFLVGRCYLQGSTGQGPRGVLLLPPDVHPRLLLLLTAGRGRGPADDQPPGLPGSLGGLSGGELREGPRVELIRQENLRVVRHDALSIPSNALLPLSQSWRPSLAVPVPQGHTPSHAYLP